MLGIVIAVVAALAGVGVYADRKNLKAEVAKAESAVETKIENVKSAAKAEVAKIIADAKAEAVKIEAAIRLESRQEIVGHGPEAFL